MTKMILTSCLLVAGQSVLAHEIKSVNEMTCADAIHMVQTQKHFYAATADGPLLVYPVNPLPAATVGYQCKGRDRIWHHIYKTRDNAACHIGYECVPGN